MGIDIFAQPLAVFIFNATCFHQKTSLFKNKILIDICQLFKPLSGYRYFFRVSGKNNKKGRTNPALPFASNI
jgi:hypothetical protein